MHRPTLTNIICAKLEKYRDIWDENYGNTFLMMREKEWASEKVRGESKREISGAVLALGQRATQAWCAALVSLAELPVLLCCSHINHPGLPAWLHNNLMSKSLHCAISTPGTRAEAMHREGADSLLTNANADTRVHTHIDTHGTKLITAHKTILLGQEGKGVLQYKVKWGWGGAAG